MSATAQAVPTMASALLYAAITEERGVDVNDQLDNFGRTALQIRELLVIPTFFLLVSHFFG